MFENIYKNPENEVYLQYKMYSRMYSEFFLRFSRIWGRFKKDLDMKLDIKYSVF